MSAKKVKPTTKQLDNTVKDVSTRLADVEKKIEDLVTDFGTMNRRHDMATETFDARTRQLLAWANEITKAAQGDDPEGMADAEKKLSPEQQAGQEEMIKEAKASAKELAAEGTLPAVKKVVEFADKK